MDEILPISYINFHLFPCFIIWILIGKIAIIQSGIYTDHKLIRTTLSSTQNPNSTEKWARSQVFSSSRLSPFSLWWETRIWYVLTKNLPWFANCHSFTSMKSTFLNETKYIHECLSIMRKLQLGLQMDKATWNWLVGYC